MLTENEVKRKMNQIYNGGPGSGNPNPGQGRGKGKPSGGGGYGGPLSAQSMSEGKDYWKPEKTVDKTSELILNDLDAYDNREDPVYMTPDEVEDALKSTGHSRKDLENAKTLDEVGNTIGSANAKQYLKEAEYTLAANEARIQAENHDAMVSGVWSKDPEQFAKDFQLDYGKAERAGFNLANYNTAIYGPDYEEEYERIALIGQWSSLYLQCKEKCLATGDWPKSDVAEVAEREWR